MYVQVTMILTTYTKDVVEQAKSWNSCTYKASHAAIRKHVTAHFGTQPPWRIQDYQVIQEV